MQLLIVDNHVKFKKKYYRVLFSSKKYTERLLGPSILDYSDCEKSQND